LDVVAAINSMDSCWIVAFHWMFALAIWAVKSRATATLFWIVRLSTPVAPEMTSRINWPTACGLPFASSSFADQKARPAGSGGRLKRF